MSPYEDLILDHWRHPRNRGCLEAPDVDITEANPLCGDVVRLQLKLDGGKVSEVRFDGRGCAISMASASLLTEMVKGKGLDELEALREEDLLAAIGGVIKPRLKCALLPFWALRKALETARKSRTVR